jgi:hypothetical protein
MTSAEPKPAALTGSVLGASLMPSTLAGARDVRKDGHPTVPDTARSTGGGPSRDRRRPRY